MSWPCESYLSQCYFHAPDWNKPQHGFDVFDQLDPVFLCTVRAAGPGEGNQSVKTG